MAAKDVVLHVYKLTPPQGSTVSFLSGILSSVGLAPFHTSLELDGYRYTFGANRGIVRTLSHKEGLPAGATYQESIPLGSCILNRGEITVLLKNLGDTFVDTAYHLVHRNCNHFTETLALCVILDWANVDTNSVKLESYPHWVNRLAQTGSAVVSHDRDIVPCNMLQEASKAVGAKDKIGWNFKPRETKKMTTKTMGHNKKELTPAQKAALAKIRKK